MIINIVTHVACYIYLYIFFFTENHEEMRAPDISGSLDLTWDRNKSLQVGTSCHIEEWVFTSKVKWLKNSFNLNVQHLDYFGVGKWRHNRYGHVIHMPLAINIHRISPCNCVVYLWFCSRSFAQYFWSLKSIAISRDAAQITTMRPSVTIVIPSRSMPHALSY